MSGVPSAQRERVRRASYAWAAFPASRAWSRGTRVRRCGCPDPFRTQGRIRRGRRRRRGLARARAEVVAAGPDAQIRGGGEGGVVATVAEEGVVDGEIGAVRDLGDLRGVHGAAGVVPQVVHVPVGGPDVRGECGEPLGGEGRGLGARVRQQHSRGHHHEEDSEGAEPGQGAHGVSQERAEEGAERTDDTRPPGPPRGVDFATGEPHGRLPAPGAGAHPATGSAPVPRLPRLHGADTRSGPGHCQCRTA